DMDSDAIANRIAFPQPVYGIASVPLLNKLFACHRQDNSLSILDTENMKLTDRIADMGGLPEQIVYDAHSGRLFVFGGNSRYLTVAEPVSRHIVSSLLLPGIPALVAANGVGHLYISLHNSDEILQIDTNTLAIIHRFIAAPGEAPGGFAFDNREHLMFCAFDGRVLVMDAQDFSVVATVEAGNHPGNVIFDEGTSLLYVANGEGTVTIFQQLGRREYKRVQRLVTQAGCRTMVLDTVSKKLYLVGMQYFSPRRPVPNSFELLVFAQHH
ncbi:MAG: YncE family protein, partial [Bacteroidetes bacterium]|nr:YncE family protein [Bacteroidota bacterium]